MQSWREGVFAEVGKAEQGRETDAAHAAHEGAFLRLEAVRPDALMPHEMQGLVLFEVVRLLKDRDIVGAAFMQIGIVLDIHRVDLKADIAEVLAREFTGLADVLDAALRLALARQHEDFLHAAVGDDFHLVLDFLGIELQAVNVIIAVEAAVDAVILAVVRDVERRKKIDRIAEMAARLTACALGHLL